MRNHSIFFLIIYFLLSGISTAPAQNQETQSTVTLQNRTVDSLNSILSATTHDTSRVNTLLELASEYYLSTPSKAMEYCEQAKTISEKKNYK